MNLVRLLLVGIASIGLMLVGIGLYLVAHIQSSSNQNNSSNIASTNAVSSAPVYSSRDTAHGGIGTRKPIRSKQVEVPPNQEWVDTGVDFNGGDVRLLVAPGRQWSSGGVQPVYSDSRGFGPYPNTIVPSAPFNSLVAKSGSQTTYVGDGVEGKMDRGRLYLSINDVRGEFKDNIGQSQIVTVMVLE